MREPKPVQRVELTEQNRKLRFIAMIALFVIGIVGITVGVVNYLNQDTGWQLVQISSQERNCSENFVLRYNFSGTGAEASAVNRTLEEVYEEACVKAYQLFTPDESIDDVNNVYYVNRHPNEVITVDPVLYSAFEKLDGTHYLYLGPVYAYYYNVILNTDDAYVEELDPAHSQEAGAYVAEIAEFAADSDAIRLELMGSNQVKLYVSGAYLEYAAQEEIETFIDFAYMTNAFVIDYLADTLAEQGLTHGYLASSDGFTRNLDDENRFSFNIFDRVGNQVYQAAAMEYQGPISMVFLKSYPTDVSDANYRVSSDGWIHLLADPADGMYRTAAENLVSYSYDTGCADVLLKMLPSFVGSDFSVPEGVFSVWCADNVICYNDEAVSFGNLLQTEAAAYRAELKK